jgi:polysaccharide biosynthesis protein PslH
MRALFLTTVLPRKRRMGSEVASQAVIDMLVQLGMKVTVLGYVRTNDNYTLDAQEICVNKRHIESKDAGLHPFIWFALSLVRRLPYSVSKYVSRQYVTEVRKLLAQDTYDFIILDHVQMSWLADAVPLRSKLIGLAHNVEYQMYRSFTDSQTGGLKRQIYARESRLIEDLERKFVNSVDQLWVLTKGDADSFAKIKKNGNVREIPLPAGTISKVTVAPSKTCDIALIGSWTWKANEEGLRWFFDHVYPSLPQHVSVHVAGSGAQWLSERYPNVSYLGFVEDASVFLQQAKVVAIPTLSGGGIQIKTLDAIASGSKIVATPLALRGIDDFPETVRIADGPVEFLTKLISALAEKAGDVMAFEARQWSILRENRFREEVFQGVKALIHGT